MHIVLVFVLSLICVIPASAQIIGQWVGDKYLVDDVGPTANKFSFAFGKVFLDADDNILESIPSLGEITDFPFPRSNRLFSQTHWHAESLYTLAFGTEEKDEDGKLFRHYIFAKWNEDKWLFQGDYKINNRITLLKAIPCDGDKFIVISSDSDLTGNKGQNRSPFHRMSVNPNEDKTEIRLNSSIPLKGLDELQQYIADPVFFSLPFLSEIVLTDNYAVAINKNTGLYWIFSLEKASLVTSGMIFKKITPKMILSGGFNDAILCVNPEKEGTILISAQDEAAFMTETGDAIKEINELLKENPKMTEDEMHKLLSVRRKELANRNPFLVWYRIYPENGKVEKLTDAPFGGTLIRDGAKTNVWRPLPDGTVRMGPLGFRTKTSDKNIVSATDDPNK